MPSGFLTHAIIRILDAVAEKVLAPTAGPEHQRTGRRGEEAAYFYLRTLGYVMVARNYRSPRRHGEIDIIGWHKNVLCFIEVKTRTTRDVNLPKPPLARRSGKNSSTWLENISAAYHLRASGVLMC
jgi:Holliday junction resolvase-like predicted endonuclease